MRSLLGLVMGLLLIMSTLNLHAQNNTVRSISVSGTVETKVAPDQIDWHVNLSAADSQPLEG
jgi:uncharacterized protein YggE